MTNPKKPSNEELEKLLLEVMHEISRAHSYDYPTPSIKHAVKNLCIPGQNEARMKVLHYLLNLQGLDSITILQIVPMYQTAKEAIKILRAHQHPFGSIKDVADMLEASIAPIKLIPELDEDKTDVKNTD